MFGFATKLNLLLSEIYITQRHKVAYYIFEKTNLAIKEIIKFALIKNPALKCLYFMAFLVKILVSIFGDSSYVSFACVAFVACETIFWGDCVVNSDRVWLLPKYSPRLRLRFLCQLLRRWKFAGCQSLYFHHKQNANR